jgi:hypothetical protein
MRSSSSSSSENEEIQRPPKGRKVVKEFIFLKSKAQSVPRGALWKLLKEEGRVREMMVSPTFSATQMKNMLRMNLPLLESIDFSR